MSFSYGIVNGSHLYGGVIGQIIRKEVDIAITDLAFTNISHTFANVTFPYAMTYIGFLVPRPKPQMSFWALAKQFRLEVWSVLLLMLIVMSVYMYTRARLFPSSVPNSDYQTSQLNSLTGETPIKINFVEGMFP